MGSNSVTSFLTKLLRPDKKDKQKQPIDNKRRHSAPIPDWYEITEAGQSTANIQKLPEKQRKQHVKYASQQNLSGTKKQKHDRSKQTNKSKRQSAGFPSWFCVSGNTETLDRTPLPLSDSESNKHNMSSSQKVAVSNEKMKGDLIPTNKGRNGRAKENRYSAPPVEWSSKKATSNGGHAEVDGKVSKPAVKQVRRELSPGVKYRTDGTLEKPYVFPAGFTFGPEGRKLQLRRTTHTQIAEEPSLSPRPNEKTVKVDVHKSSTGDIIMEYSYETSNADLGQFDVRKAFYLKYDSDFSEAKTHESSVDGHDRDRQHAFNYTTDPSYIYTGDTDEWQNNKIAGKIAGTIIGEDNTIAHEENGNPKDRCRYSIPPKNDDLVYMGSFENVSISDYTPSENDVSKSALNVGGNMRRSGRDTTRNRRNRYSMPTRNADLVYMGSFENVNQLLNSKTNMAPGLSLFSGTNETDDLSQHNGGEGCTASSQVQVDQPEECSTVVNDKSKSVLSGYIYHKRFDPVVQPSAKASPNVAEVTEHTSLRSFERSSNSDIDSSTHLITADKNSEKNARSTSRDEGSAFHAKSCEVNEKNPFLTRRGRSSCMPGNTRYIAPPPAITTSCISTNSADLNSARTSSFMPGSKPFSIPPPPNYTPPKEEMEFTHAQLKEMNCHKGSQTDLSIEFENLTMEDRDTCLQQDDVKTIYSGATTLIADAFGGDQTDRAKLNRLIVQARTPKNNSVNLELYQQMIDVSDLSHGSDEVFQDTQSSVSEDNARTKTRRFTKFKSKVSSNLELNKLPTSSSLSLAKELDQRSLNSESKMTNRITSSDASCKHPFLASKTTTPARSDQLQLQCSYDRNVWTPRDKPTPTPRKIYHADSMSKKSSILSESIDTQQAFTCNVVHPVPKQRHSLTYSRSISPSNSYEPISSPIVSQDEHRSNRQHLLRTQSCDQSSTLLRRQNNLRSEVSQSVFSHNIYVSIDDENIYEEIDPQLIVSGLNDSKHDNIYEECGNIDSVKRGNKLQKNQTQNSRGKNEKQRLETSLSPLQTITLSSSPGQRRRNLNPPKDQPPHSIPVQQPQHNCVMATTHVQQDAVSARTEHDKGAVVELIDVNKMYQRDDSDDNSSIADDEMSLSNEEDMEEVAKRYSLRRCVSADNLLRSGSIIDRLMILAKRRRKRMRERRSKSHLQLFTDDNYNFTKTSLKAHYTKRKRTSNERLFKQKPSHTDSGHDSEIVSPCTSPDTRRHVDNISLIHGGDSNDISDSWVPRQGTLPRKSWEIRLRNTQYLRKCRSRESLLTPSEKMYAPCNSAFEADY